PFHLLGLRFAAAVLTLILLRLLGIVTIKVTWPQFKALLPLAFFQPILYFPFETLGVQLTSSSQGGMMIAAIPIFVTILAAVVLKERPRPLQYPFILASVGGVIFIMAMQNQGQLEAKNWAPCCCWERYWRQPATTLPPAKPASASRPCRPLG
ncbi:MAG TPA: hypothetical protein DDY38_03570, partial [Firmicutes bacterium]|nr:hypothetical protein [Bacillota bacterium]